MTKEALIEKIEALPPEKKAELERFVERLASRSTADDGPMASGFHGLIERIEARRERLLKERGLFPDSVPLIREFRETGE